MFELEKTQLDKLLIFLKSDSVYIHIYLILNQLVLDTRNNAGDILKLAKSLILTQRIMSRLITQTLLVYKVNLHGVKAIKATEIVGDGIIVERKNNNTLRRENCEHITKILFQLYVLAVNLKVGGNFDLNNLAILFAKINLLMAYQPKLHKVQLFFKLIQYGNAFMIKDKTPAPSLAPSLAYLPLPSFKNRENLPRIVIVNLPLMIVKRISFPITIKISGTTQVPIESKDTITENDKKQEAVHPEIVQTLFTEDRDSAINEVVGEVGVSSF